MAKKIAVVGKSCVACGTCEGFCPKGAISIYKGIAAKINDGSCVGCSKCEKICPVGIIDMKERAGVF